MLDTLFSTFGARDSHPETEYVYTHECILLYTQEVEIKCAHESILSLRDCAYGCICVVHLVHVYIVHAYVHTLRSMHIPSALNARI